MDYKKQSYENLIDGLIEKFNMRGIDCFYCSDSQAALDTAKHMLTPGCSVSSGGSVTLSEIGLTDMLKNSDFVYYDRSDAKSAEEKTEMYGHIATCDYFFMSSNAITMDGQLVNIDGFGNRVACLIAGPKNVIVIAGVNKIVRDVDEALSRVRNFAAPPNCIRLNKDTPCAKFGRCADCLVDDCICAQIVITRKSMIPGRIKVILVGEPLGY